MHADYGLAKRSVASLSSEQKAAFETDSVKRCADEAADEKAGSD